jgi:hypothetical protein
MNALDGVLADLVEADRECAYVTVKREPLETLIDEWARRGDQMSLLFRLVAPAQLALAQEVLDGWAAAVARHRHAVRREFAARLKQLLRSAIADVGAHVTDAWLAGNSELAERLESERQTVRIIMNTIDTLVDRLIQDELTVAADKRKVQHQQPGSDASAFSGQLPG